MKAVPAFRSRLDIVNFDLCTLIFVLWFCPLNLQRMEPEIKVQRTSSLECRTGRFVPGVCASISDRLHLPND